MKFTTVLTLALALVSLGNATAPVPITSSSQLKTIYIDDMTIRAFVVTVEFDQPIYVNGIPITHPNMTTSSQNQQQQSQDNNCNGNGGGGGGGPNFPPLAFQMDGKLRIDCGSMNWNVDLQHDNQDGPPRSILSTVTTSDPGSSFMGFLSGFAMPEYINPNAISFVKLISGSKGGQFMNMDANTTEASIRTCGNKTISIQPGVISNAAREFYNPIAPIVLSSPPKAPTCDFNSISGFKQAFDYVSNIAKVLAVDSSLYKQFSFLQGALDSRDALAACKSLVDPMFTTETILKRLSPTRQCVYQYGTPEYLQSPCCNRNLQFSQCCAPVSPLTNITIVKNITVDRIRSQCSHPDKIILTLYSYINTVNSVPIQTENEDSLRQRFEKFSQTCNSLVYGKKCTVDADCQYTQSCDTQQGQCKVPWGQDADLMLSCFYDQFDPLLRSSLAGLWSLDESDKTSFVTRMQSLLLMDDCVGGNSWNLQTKCDYRNNCKICTYSNQTTCLAPKSCNWNWQIQNQHDCVATSPADPSTHFCGQCFGDGSNCWSQSVPDLCVRDNYKDEQSCTAASFTWYVGPWQQGTCVDPTKKTRSECLPTKACPQLSPDGHNCESWGSHVCYAPNVTVDECNAASSFTNQLNNGQTYRLEWQPWRNAGSGVCAFNRQWGQNSDFSPQFCGSFSAAVNNKSVLYFPGGYWSEGQFNTQQKCQTGRCNWQDPKQRESSWGLTTDQCQKKQMCNQPCPRCRSNQWVGPGVSNYCYSVGNNITSMDECSRKMGNWYQNVVGSQGRCIFTQDSATASRSVCLAYGQSIGVDTGFASCDSLGLDTCSDKSASDVGELGSWLQCFWDMNAQCRDPSECARSGRCNDDDKVIWRQNGFSIPGSCHVDNVLNENGWPSDCNSLKSKSLPPTNQTLTWSRYPMKCVDPLALNATACSAIGGQWKTKAKTRDECLADMACYDEGSNWPNGKSASECSKCSGTMAPIYNWSPAQWVNASMDPLSWKNKSYSSVNQWGKRVNQDVLEQVIVDPAQKYYLGSTIYSSLTAKYSLVSDLFHLFSCDCTDGREQRNCFGEIRASPISSTFLQKGKLNKIETPLGVIKAALRGNNSNNFIGRRLLSGGPVTITVAQVTAQSLAELGPNNAPDYQVVRASPYRNRVVGQLVGEGMQVSGFTSDISQVSLGLYLSQQITLDTVSYPTPWIAYLKANTTKVYPLRGIDVQLSNGTITTSNITADGTYFPVYLQSNWTAALVTTKMSTMSSSGTMTPTASLLKKTTTMSVNPTAVPLDNGSPAPTSVTAAPATPAPAPGTPTPAPGAPTPAPATTQAPTASAAIQRQPLPFIVVVCLCVLALF